MPLWSRRRSNESDARTRTHSESFRENRAAASIEFARSALRVRCVFASLYRAVHTIRSPTNTSQNQIVHDAIDYLFLAIQCRAKAGTRKKNTITTRSWMKNSSTSVPNSFSSVLKRCVAQDAPVFQNRSVATK